MNTHVSATLKKQIKEQIALNEEEYLNLLFELLRQPSISAQQIGVDECAQILKRQLLDYDIEATIYETKGSPIVYGEIINPKNTKTILIYGHYDVQPPEPIEAWETPPFEPSIRNGKIYARGVGDNKGQMLAHVFAIKTLRDLQVDLPVNVKFLFDGEEESSSHSLPAFIKEHQELLAADVLYNADGPLDSTGRPIVYLGNRGMLYVELTAIGATQDNHSGNKGNIVPNPAWKLINVLQSMREGTDGEVLIEGFYDDVRPVTIKDIRHLQEQPFDLQETGRVIGYEALDMSGEEYYEKLTLTPTFNISGLSSGYSGTGKKTVIPSEAKVKIDIRLVADQDPDDIYRKLVAHIQQVDPSLDIEWVGASKPTRTSMELESVRQIISSVHDAHELKPIVLPAIGATFPGYLFQELLKTPSLLIPYANADEDNHAPNENMDVELFFKGIETTCHVILNIGK
ncbi:M20/M25/M40 family metallo-hydrolase [Geomicrobium sp. JCM 19038]|uniref:M20/M25/M40 family metallo-hydrolase n=1 Tax=Geomicrobium sp. JCM 19038 TaxID=1460635 RepID=UPI00045F2CBC|nr:M20/M25/M40 family metallo-hydrolase [Geomicrobium sp. JCM 19038]GAK10164.1 acetylornithine deacetylase/succinyl-diaminopimelate desuccinylase and related deacylase [Geomicrobium sp. JCM 19038]